MNDERIVEVIKAALVENPGSSVPYIQAPRVLAALRADGFDVYRPEDCMAVEVSAYEEAPTVEAAPGLYRLVPVEGD